MTAPNDTPTSQINLDAVMAAALRRSVEIVPHEPELTIVDRARLVQIAHEAGASDVRKWALDTLERASAPPFFVKAAP